MGFPTNTAVTHQSSVGLALVAESKDQDDGENSQDNGEQDANIIMWLKREKKIALYTC